MLALNPKVNKGIQWLLEQYIDQRAGDDFALQPLYPFCLSLFQRSISDALIPLPDM